MSTVMDLTDDHGSLPPLAPSTVVLQGTTALFMAPGKAPNEAGGEKVSRGPYKKRKPKAEGSPGATAAADGTSTSENPKIKKDKLVSALQSRIEVPIYGIGTLRRYLEDADWNQDNAYANFMADFHAVGTGPTVHPNPDSTAEAREGLPSNIRGALVVIHDSQEEQRREAMRLLRSVISIDRDPHNQLHLTLTEAFFTLLLTSWDVEAAALRWASEDVIRWQIHHTFDHLRTTTTDQVEIDERIARFVHFTGRDDWHSIRDFLDTHNQQFMNAVRAWYQSGMPVVRTLDWNSPERLYVGRRVTCDGVPRSSMPSDTGTRPTKMAADVWPAAETTFRPAGMPPSDPLAQPLEILHSIAKRIRGFCFTPEVAAQAGGIFPQHFTTDYLQNGRYFANGFPWKNWYRPEFSESAINKSTNPIFDQHNRDHVAVLGRWIRQQRARAEGTLKRASPQKFTQEEVKFLFKLCKRQLKKVLADNPGKTAADFRPLEFSKAAIEKLERDFNEAFEGKVFPGKKPGSVPEPRRHRLGVALKTKCGRTKLFQDAFGFMNNNYAGDIKDSREWSGNDDAATSRQGPTAVLKIPDMRTAAEQSAAAVRQSNRDEEDANETIDADANGLLQRMQAEGEKLVDGEEALELWIHQQLQQGLELNEANADARAVVRHIMRRLGMIVPGEAAADHLPTAEAESKLLPPRLTGRQRAMQRRQENMALEDSISDIDALAAAHHQHLRNEANQRYGATGSLFPSNAEVEDRVRLAIHAEIRNGKITDQHAAALRRLMRTIGMVPPEEGDVIDDGEEMEVDGVAVGEKAPEGNMLDEEVPDFDTLDWTDCFSDDVLGSEGK